MAGKEATTKNLSAKNSLVMDRLQVLVCIVDRKKADSYADLIQTYGANFQFTMVGEGTAHLNKIGYMDDKSIISSVIKEDDAKAALASLAERFKTIRGGNGIAFTVDFSSLIGRSTFEFLSNNRDSQAEEENVG